MRKLPMVLSLCLLGCAGEALISEGEELSITQAPLAAPATQDWSLFPDRMQCLAGIQVFYPRRFGVRVPTARNAWTGNCAPEGACHLWLDDVPSPAQWERIAWDGTARPSAYDLVVYPPSSTNPWGHVASVDHVDAAGNIFVMDDNFNGDERKAAAPHTVSRPPYGWYHLRTLPKTTTGRASTKLDFDGDGCDDLWGSTKAGALSLYSGDCAGGFKKENQVIGSGWNALDSITATADFDGDGCADVLARLKADGRLLLYPGTCTGSLRDGKVIGTLWNSLRSISAPGDLDGDGCADVIARSADQRLLLFPGNCRGAFKSEAVTIGTGWGSLDVLLGGDFTGDQCPDVLASSTAGQLLLFRNDCRGHLSEAAVAGTGWQGFDALLSRDWSGDGCSDVLGRLPDGRLRLYRGTCAGGVHDGVQVGYGFQAFGALH